MALFDSDLTRPNQKLDGTDELELAIEEYTGIVEGTIKRRSKLEGFIPVRTVKGTSTITNFGIGESTLQALVPGEEPDGKPTEFNRNSLTIDTVVLARNIVPLLDDFQASFNVRSEIGVEHGKKIAKFYDQAFFIQAAKAALAATSTFGALDGHTGGSTETMAAAGDINDPAKLYAGLANLFAKMEAKDVDPANDDVMVALRPDVFYKLLQAEQIINGEYVTAAGTQIKGAKILSAFGVPVISTNDVPRSNITGHLLSNARNSNAYDGDFSKVVATAFSPRALMAGSTIPLTTKVFFDDRSKHWFIDAYLSFAVGPNRREYAGGLLLP